MQKRTHGKAQTVTVDAFRTDPARYVRESAQEPIRVVGEDGEVRMTLSAPTISAANEAPLTCPHARSPAGSLCPWCAGVNESTRPEPHEVCARCGGAGEGADGTCWGCNGTGEYVGTRGADDSAEPRDA